MPLLPHADDPVAWHVPVPSQQPPGQLAALQRHWPLTHIWPAPHVLPHDPQLPSSVCVLTHANPPQSVRPSAQSMVQTLPSQLATPLPCVGPGQLVPQLDPQLLGSELSTHALLQAWAPGRQVYPHVVPPVHVGVAFAGAAHVPHAAPTPQLFGSLLAAQLALLPVPQRWSLALHVKPQTPPAEQVDVPPVTAGHCVLQPPQWLGSVCSSTHEAPHRLSPGAHPEVQAKGWLVLVVFEQSGKPPEHTVAQLPQCAARLNSVSQPSSGFDEQIPNVGAHEVLSNVQTPLVQPTLPATCGRFVQSCPHVPQL